MKLWAKCGHGASERVLAKAQNAVYQRKQRGYRCTAYIAKIFGAQNTGRPQETFSNAPGKSNAIRRSSARPKSSSRNMIGWGTRSA
jgi:hypothetical protein